MRAARTIVVVVSLGLAWSGCSASGSEIRANGSAPVTAAARPPGASSIIESLVAFTTMGDSSARFDSYDDILPNVTMVGPGEQRYYVSDLLAVGTVRDARALSALRTEFPDGGPPTDVRSAVESADFVVVEFALEIEEAVARENALPRGSEVRFVLTLPRLAPADRLLEDARHLGRVAVLLTAPGEGRAEGDTDLWNVVGSGSTLLLVDGDGGLTMPVVGADGGAFVARFPTVEDLVRAARDPGREEPSPLARSAAGT